MFDDFRYVYHITDWGRTGRTIGVLVGVTIALVTFHAFFCLVARLVLNADHAENMCIFGGTL